MLCPPGMKGSGPKGLGSGSSSGPSCLDDLEEAPRLRFPLGEVGTLGMPHSPGVGAGVQGSHSDCDRALMSFVNWQLRTETQGGPHPRPPTGETQAWSGSRDGRAPPPPWVWCPGLRHPAQRRSPVPQASSAGRPQGGAQDAVFPELPLLPPVAGGGLLPGSQAQRGLKMAIPVQPPALGRNGLGQGGAGCPGSVCPRLPGVGGGLWYWCRLP